VVVKLPDVTGLSVFDAALAFADAGIPIAPFDPKQGKRCGNMLGHRGIREALGIIDAGKWYDHATANTATLTRWNATLPFEAIATSPGRFGAVVLDIDKPQLFPSEFREACKSTAHVLTRKRRRGHYHFLTTTPIGNPSFEWGEVRCIGGGLVLPPYPYDDRRVARPGALHRLPADLLALIAGSGVVGPAVDLERFCAKHQGNKYPGKLRGLVRIHELHLARGANPHNAMKLTLHTGLGEAALGFVPAKAVLATLRRYWDRNPQEFDNLAIWTATVIESSDLTELEAISRRGKGTDSRQYAGKLK
jgi:hypothetical protein